MQCMSCQLDCWMIYQTLEVASHLCTGEESTKILCEISFVKRINRTALTLIKNPPGTPQLIGRGFDVIYFVMPFLRAGS